MLLDLLLGSLDGGEGTVKTRSAVLKTTECDVFSHERSVCVCVSKGFGEMVKHVGCSVGKKK